MSELIDNIADFMARPRGAETPSAPLAAAVLLIELARQDADYGDEERSEIANLLRTHFHLQPRDAAQLVKEAEAAAHSANDDFAYRNTLAHDLELEERKQIIAMLWQVALADGSLMPLEASLIQRIGQSLELDEEAIKAARPQDL